MERIDFTKMKTPVLHQVLKMFLERYVFAFEYMLNKKVFDAGCGTGLGTCIYSLAAKSIVAVDKSKKGLEKAKRNTYYSPVEFIHGDLNTMQLPTSDVCVAIEVLEHLKPGNDFLKRLNTKLLVFSVPINMPGDYHLQVWKTPDNIMDYLFSVGWATKMCYNDTGSNNVRVSNASLVGIAERV